VSEHLGKGFFECLGEGFMGAAGEIVGETVKIVGELTDSEFIEKAGDDVSRVTKKTGKTIGNLTDNAVGIGAGIIMLDRDKVEESVNGALKTTVNTANDIFQGTAGMIHSTSKFINDAVNGGEQEKNRSKNNNENKENKGNKEK
jgi:hypothetical protein